MKNNESELTKSDKICITLGIMMFILIIIGIICYPIVIHDNVEGTITDKSKEERNEGYGYYTVYYFELNSSIFIRVNAETYYNNEINDYVYLKLITFFEYESRDKNE